MQQQARQWQQTGQRIALVPTMGFLHDGHLSLMKQGRDLADKLVASIFVNPTQFGPEEDLEAYPRNLKRDLSLCEKVGVDAVFLPTANEIYGSGYETWVTLDNLPNHLCGLFRPAHFRGVATIVAKLFNSVMPHVAIFGLKDYQQYLVIKKLAQDLSFDIQIVGGPIVREPDGLAMSSRNSYLTTEQRKSARGLYTALQLAAEMVQSGVTDVSALTQRASEVISHLPETSIDYISICDAETLADIQSVQVPALMALAVRVGRTRLIDNCILTPPRSGIF